MADRSSHLPLEGVKVIEVATMVAAPFIGLMMGDFGAEVIKVEHPDTQKEALAARARGRVPLGGKVSQRNKKSITLNLSTSEGQAILKRLLVNADVLLENFRPGVMERWHLGWEELHQLFPKLVMVRMTGYGQYGPYSDRPSFGTVGEAMSGFANIVGQPDGPPSLPPFALADSIAGLFGTFATMFALYGRDVLGVGQGQMIDVSIYEPIFSIIGDHAINYDQTGVIARRVGNRSIHSAPRNTYVTKEGRWVALSASAPGIFKRVLRIAGGEQAVNDPRFQTPEDRLKHYDEIDELIGGWVKQHTLEEVMDIFAKNEAAIGPVYDIAQIFQDPQYKAREDIITVQDDELGAVRMQGIFPKMSLTPGRVAWTGPRPGQHNDDVYKGQLGMSSEEIERLLARGVI